jgi:N-acetylglucosamine kinase-like BadF-type ATPase
MVFAGVDGGQTSTLAVVGDEGGRVLGRGIGPAADLVGEPRDSDRQARAIDAAIESARRAAGLEPDSVFEAIVCGLSGYDEEGETPPRLQTRARQVRLVHDSEIALAGALGAAAGIVVIGGTGSVALGLDDEGRRARVGGWGFLFGDEGSAFWMARRAATLAMHRADRGEESALARALLTHTSLPSLRALQQAFAHGELTRSALAAFAPPLLELARAGDVEAHLIRSEAARALAELARRAHAQLAPVQHRRVSYVGGLFADEPLIATWREAVAERIAGALIAPPLAEPACGALQLACRMAHA